jgi:cob(I)alamin adenosyltransferase
MEGAVHVFTGEGQGKIEAAMGIALRTAGQERKVYMVRFLQADEEDEWKALGKFGGEFVIRHVDNSSFEVEDPVEANLRAARAEMAEVGRVIRSGDYSLVILDNSSVAACYGLFPIEEQLALIEVKPPHVTLVFAGCCADPRLISKADFVTDMREVKRKTTIA